MEELRDIRGLERIDDISFYLFLSAVVVGVILFFALIHRVYKYYKNSKKEDIKAKVLDRLKRVDLSEPKTAAYLITKYARFLAEDERSKKIFSELEDRLKKYKYKKNSPKEFLKEDIGYYDLFLKVVDE
jgi:hypothetical protein